MKKFLLIQFCLVVFAAQSGLPQQIPHRATLTPSKAEILLDEVFTVTYELSDVEGYFYVAVVPDYWDVIGQSRWQGHIRQGEKIHLNFKLKLSDDAIPHINSKLMVSVKFNQREFGAFIQEGTPVSVSVRLKDYEKIHRQYGRTKQPRNFNPASGDTLPLPDLLKDFPGSEVTISNDTSTRIQQSPPPTPLPRF
jgi:hypothetical protein